MFRATGAGPDMPGPTYNAAPGAELDVVAEATPGRQVGLMRWGLVQGWNRADSSRPRPINIRAETALAKAPFADALIRGRRCLVPAAGFYEFRKDEARRSHPFLFVPLATPVLAMAGIWSHPRGGEATFAIITTEANGDVAPIHHRMPAVVDPAEWDGWLDRDNADAGWLASRLVPAPVGSLECRPVSRRVNDARNDGAHLLNHLTD